MPLEYKLLKIIDGYIDEYFAGMECPKTVRANEIYTFLSRKKDVKEYISNPIEFNRFIRKMHDKGIMKQFIGSYDVDTSLYHHYKWHFYPRGKSSAPASSDPNCTHAPVHAGTNDYKSEHKSFEAANGVKVRSSQELYIMNRLLA